MWCRLDWMEQTIPHSQLHAISASDLQMFSPSQALPAALHAKTGSPTRKLAFCHFHCFSPGWYPSYIVLVDSGEPHSLSRWPFVAGGFWAVIFSRAMWKRSWVGCDPTQSKMTMNRMVATTGIVSWV